MSLTATSCVRFAQRSSRQAMAVAALVAMSACSSAGGLGNILGGVLGGGTGGNNQVSGNVQSVDQRSQQIGIRQSNGQTVFLSYDNNTRVTYQNQSYSPTNLESGDNVTATVQDNGNGGYYTAQVVVNQSVRSSTNGGQNTNGLQSYQGTVRQVDRSNGYFTIDDANAGRITVVLPSNLRRVDADRYNTLRSGDVVRFSAYRTGNSQVQLNEFY